MMELKGHVAIVTGGARGIGLGIATELAEGGARVAIIDLDEERVAQAAYHLPGQGHIGLACNVADSSQVREGVRQVDEELGGATILGNNAGITRDNILLRMKDEDWDEVIGVNLKGTFNMTRSIIRGMMKRRDGVILNISSVVGLSGNAGQANYAASKAGVIGFTKSVARELASRGIRCNAIAPGFVATDMTRALEEAQIEALKQQIPLGRLGCPEDIAKVARFLAGPAACYITGQVIAVDGGMCI